MGDNFVERSRDWFRQAEKDLGHAHHSVEGGDFEWACFAAQQSAEKALKGLYQALAGEGRGHSISELLDGLAEKIVIPDYLKPCGLVLDGMFILSPSPRAYDDGIPADRFDEDDAWGAIRECHAVLDFVRPQIP